MNINLIHKLAFKVLKKYKTRVEMINMLHKIGLDKQCSMTLELVLLGKTDDRIKRVLLFTDESFEIILDTLYDFLRSHDKKVKLFKKLHG